MTRQIDGFQPLNANIRTKIGVKDLDIATAGIGTVPAAVAAYITATEYGDESFHKTVLTCVDLPLSIADDAGVAQYGGVKVYTMPQGAICSFGTSIKGTLTLGVTGTIIDAFTGVNALGTVTASTGSTLTSTEATWQQSTANATAAAKVAAISSCSVATALTESPGRVVDGRSTAAPVFLNFAIADDASHTAGTGKFSGTITIAWVNLGGV
jgi:hypothetical protein